MCGIAGIVHYGSDSNLIDADLLLKIRDRMTHRGPDGAGLWVADNRRTGIAHRRLAVVDPTPEADQPLFNRDRTLCLSFNGEIYNHQELRETLTQAGHSDWQTDHSDSEVLLRAFEHWGIDCLQYLRGMFAFAVWDERSKELWLVRDRLGVKPLYYSMRDGRLSFASELRALLCDRTQSREINEDALFYYLSFLLVPTEDTLVRGVHKLPAASWLKLSSDGSVRKERYWDPWDHTTPLENVSNEEMQGLIQDTLRESVTIRSKADVPVGAFLSGGIDSSAVATLLSETCTGPLETFTTGYEQNTKHYQNENDFAQLVIDRINAKSNHQYLSIGEVIHGMQVTAELDDEPSGYGVNVPTYYTAKLAREKGIIVSHIGEGVDELFGGYDSWLYKLKLQGNLLNEHNSILPRKLHSLIHRRSSAGVFESEYRERIARGQPIFWGGTEFLCHNAKLRLVSPRLRKLYADRTAWDGIEPFYKRFQEKAWDKSTLNWMSYVDTNARLPEMLLKRADRMTMAFGIEARVPCLDHKFVELSLSIPAKSRIQRDIPKYIMREAMRGLIPDAVIDRPKQGWALPVPEFLEHHLGDYAKHELETFCDNTDLFDKKEVMALLKQYSWNTWPVLSLALWHKHSLSNV